MVTRQAAQDEEICGYSVPKGAYIACLISAVHETEWQEPREWRPERFLAGGEYESFDNSIRPHKVSFLGAVHSVASQMRQAFMPPRASECGPDSHSSSWPPYNVFFDLVIC